MNKSTLPLLYHPLMQAPSTRYDRCPICGRMYPLNQHHIVWRSWGELFDDNGNRLPKPTITLCGVGNNMPYCHGKAHNRMLHFKWEDGCLWYLETDRPTKYQKALGMDGWKKVQEPLD